jgi:hypothetical protein
MKLAISMGIYINLSIEPIAPQFCALSSSSEATIGFSIGAESISDLKTKGPLALLRARSSRHKDSANPGLAVSYRIKCRSVLSADLMNVLGATGFLHSLKRLEN